MDAFMSSGMIIVGVVAFIVVVIPAVFAKFLRNVEAGEIRLVSWLAGGTIKIGRAHV